jgi:ATP-dependent helicase/DNAse subunit B
MRVTAFRSYLRSPYGFFLEHVRRIEECSDRADSLDPLSFGTMVHETLRDFATGPAASSSHENEIRSALRSALDAYIAQMFGSTAPVSVQLQRAQAAERLDEFAALQADWRRKGWRILHAEWSPEAGAPFDVDGTPMLLRGKIDRIDRHDESGQFLILDYKTSEKGDTPGETHLARDGQWIDLQLPLYRHLAATIVGSAPVGLGYIVIPGQPQDVKVHQAEWSEAQLQAADNAARDVVRKIRAGEFFSLGDQPPDSGILGAICGLNLVTGDPGPDPEDES